MAAGERVDRFRSACMRGDHPDVRVAQATRYDPHDANDGRRFQIALVLQTISDWVDGFHEYRPLWLLTAVVARAGKSFVIRAPTDLVRKLLAPHGGTKVYAPTGVAAFHVGGSTGRSLPQLPTLEKAIGQLEPLKGDAMRKFLEN